MKLHIVQKGDTLWKIAKKYGVNFEELKKMNTQLSNPDMIMPGMKIKVPTGGGNIKKEAPISGGTPQAKINMGGKKEMPIAEHPFTKEKPKPMPEEVKMEAPKAEIPKEAPIKEQPKKEMPVQEAPKPVKKEEAVKPYTPKMPKPIMPEIDINNYYMMNMANMQLPQQPQLPPKPDNIFPEIKPQVKPEVKPEIKPEVKPQVKPQAKAEMKPNAKPEIKSEIKIQKNEFMEESPSMMPLYQGGYQQPMIPYPYNCYPGAPSMHGPGYGNPWAQQMMPYPQVQGAGHFPGMMPNMPMQMEDMESSSFDQQMPLSKAMDENVPGYMQPEGSPQMSGPIYYGVPVSPIMPGPGWYPHYGPGYPQHMPMPYMPQVGGMMDNQMMPQVGGMMDDESSEMPMPQMPQLGGMMGNQMPPQVGGMMGNQMPPQVGGMMGNQMPPQVGGMMENQMPPQLGGMMGNQMPPQVGGMMENQMPPQVGGMMQQPMMPKQAVQGMANDCGCGGTMGNPYIPMNPGLHPMHPHYGYPMNPGLHPMHMHPHYGFQMGVRPFGSMDPFGPGADGSGPEMPVYYDESNEY